MKLFLLSFLPVCLGLTACSEKKHHGDPVHADGTHHDHGAEPGLPSAAYADSVNRGLIAQDTVKSRSGRPWPP